MENGNNNTPNYNDVHNQGVRYSSWIWQDWARQEENSYTGTETINIISFIKLTDTKANNQIKTELGHMHILNNGLKLEILKDSQVIKTKDLQEEQLNMLQYDKLFNEQKKILEETDILLQETRFLRLKTQTRLEAAQKSRDNLISNIKIIKEEFFTRKQRFRKGNNNDNDKCIVCCSRPIKYVWIPCYHYGNLNMCAIQTTIKRIISFWVAYCLLCANI